MVIIRYRAKHHVVSLILTVIYLAIAGRAGYRFWQVYERLPRLPITSQTREHVRTHDFSFLYANIFYKNEHIDQLQNTIKTYNPDVILLVEYSKIHHQLLTSVLQKQYPYISRYTTPNGYDGDTIFSKYPFEKIPHSVYPGSFSHIRLHHPKDKVDIALIHTSAPVSPSFFQMRTQQLTLLQELMSKHINKHNYPQMLMGDFNITPRSPYYGPQLSNPFKNIGLTNLTTNHKITQYVGSLPYTRCFQEQFPCAHIDHIRSSFDTMELQQVIIEGSDHTGFFGKVWLP